MAKSRRKQTSDDSPVNETAPQAVGDTTAAAPDRDRVAMRAYELYQARGGTDGQALEDWLAAESELQRSRDDHGET